MAIRDYVYPEESIRSLGPVFDQEISGLGFRA